MTRFLRICCVVSVFALPGMVSASVVTVPFSGTVTQVPLDEVFGDIGFGDAILGSFRFDTSASDLIPGDPATGSYSFEAPLGLDVRIGLHNFTLSGFLNIGIVNSFVDQFSVFAQNPGGDLTVELLLQDNTSTAFANDHLPLSTPPFSSFGQRDFHFDGVFDGGEVQLDGRLDAAPEAQVPEPRSGELLAGTACTLLVLARRKRVWTSSN